MLRPSRVQFLDQSARTDAEADGVGDTSAVHGENIDDEHKLNTYNPAVSMDSDNKMRPGIIDLQKTRESRARREVTGRGSHLSSVHHFF